MQHELITLYKPDGRPVNVNESSIDAAILLGWLKEDPTLEAKKIEAEKPKKHKK